jgi:hypothetical protein
MGMIHGVDPKGDLARSILVRPDPTGDLALATSIPTPDPKGDLAPPILAQPDPTGDLAHRILVPPDPQGGFSPPDSIRRTTLGGRHRGLRPVGNHVDRSGGVRDREHAGHAGFAGRRPTSGGLSHGRHPGSRPLRGSEHAEQVGQLARLLLQPPVFDGARCRSENVGLLADWSDGWTYRRVTRVRSRA